MWEPELKCTEKYTGLRVNQRETETLGCWAVMSEHTAPVDQIHLRLDLWSGSMWRHVVCSSRAHGMKDSSPLRVQQSLLRMVLVDRLIIHGSVLGWASNKPITALKARYTAPQWIIILWWCAVSHRGRFMVEFYLLCTTLHQGPRVPQDPLLTMWLTKWQLIISLTLVPSLIFTVAIKQEQPWVPQTHAVPQWVR